MSKGFWIISLEVWAKIEVKKKTRFARRRVYTVPALVGHLFLKCDEMRLR